MDIPLRCPLCLAIELAHDSQGGVVCTCCKSVFPHWRDTSKEPFIIPGEVLYKDVKGDFDAEVWPVRILQSLNRGGAWLTVEAGELFIHWPITLPPLDALLEKKIRAYTQFFLEWIPAVIQNSNRGYSLTASGPGFQLWGDGVVGSDQNAVVETYGPAPSEYDRGKMVYCKAVDKIGPDGAKTRLVEVCLDSSHRRGPGGGQSRYPCLTFQKGRWEGQKFYPVGCTDKPLLVAPLET